MVIAIISGFSMGVFGADEPNASIVYRQTLTMGKGQFKKLQGVTVDPQNRVWASGDEKVVRFDAEGKTEAIYPLPARVRCVAVAEDGHIYVGGGANIYKLAPDTGKVLATFTYKSLQNISGIDCYKNDVIVADSRARGLFYFDASGKLVRQIASKPGASRGMLATCCGILDFGIEKTNGTIYVAHLGAHRVEMFDIEGKRLGSWGRRGRDVADFSGCCNPKSCSVAPNGLVVVSESGMERVKLYTPDGKMLSLMGANDLHKGCFEVDVAADAKLNIYVVDDHSHCVRRYSPAASAKEAD